MMKWIPAVGPKPKMDQVATKTNLRMRIGIAILLAGFCVLAVLVAIILGQIGYAWATYIDDTVYSGSAYGFEIGSSKKQVVRDMALVSIEYPNTHVYGYEERTGNSFSIPVNDTALDVLDTRDHWELLLDGKWEFWDSIDLYFQDEKLIKIHRHRQLFEIP
jgi:hypothetical protein